jgi:hypothetical protein
MKRAFGFLLWLVFADAVLAAEVSCNERFRQGRIGAVKAIAAGACMYTGHHLILKSFWNSYADFGWPKIDDLEMRRDTSSVFATVCSAITLGALVYVTYKLSSEAVESLNIFFDDGEEVEGALLQTR